MPQGAPLHVTISGFLRRATASNRLAYPRVKRTAGCAAVSEIYSSGGHDSGDDDASRPDRGYSSFGSGWGNPWRPDHSVYDRDAPGDHDSDPGGDDDYYDADPDLGMDRYGDPAEQEQGMTRAQYGEYMRNQSPDAGTEDNDSDLDDDIDAILHEDDHLPDPRTRQEAARQDAARGEAPTLTQGHAETGDTALGEHPYPSTSVMVPISEPTRQRTLLPRCASHSSKLTTPNSARPSRR